MGRPNDNDLIETEEVDSFLAHYGVKGMKWGVRKDTPKAGSSSGPPKKPEPKKATAPEGKPERGKDGRIKTAPAQKLERSTKPKPADDLSDEELRRAIARIDMERKFAQLTAPPPSKMDKAVKFVSDILLDVGRTQAKVLLNGVATNQMVKSGIVPPQKKVGG